MQSKFFLLATSIAILPTTYAHYFFPHLIVDGNFTGYFEYVRSDTQGYMPQKGIYNSNDFRCNTGSEASAAVTDVYTVQAGSEIGFGTDFNAEIEHPGPLQVYMSKAPGDVHDYDGSGDWFKIYELGPKAFTTDGIEWGVTGIGNFTFTLPEETPAGQYLVRIEHIALHGAAEWGGAELYYNCAQIKVLSSSTAVPGPTVKIPGVYTGYEPGIMFNMYRPDITNYTIPGPAVWPGNGTSDISTSTSIPLATSTKSMLSQTAGTAGTAGISLNSSSTSTYPPYPFVNTTSSTISLSNSDISTSLTAESPSELTQVPVTTVATPSTPLALIQTPIPTESTSTFETIAPMTSDVQSECIQSTLTIVTTNIITMTVTA